jgi:hypothetical protein
MVAATNPCALADSEVNQVLFLVWLLRAMARRQPAVRLLGSFLLSISALKVQCWIYFFMKNPECGDSGNIY